MCFFVQYLRKRRKILQKSLRVLFYKVVPRVQLGPELFHKGQHVVAHERLGHPVGPGARVRVHNRVRVVEVHHGGRSCGCACRVGPLRASVQALRQKENQQKIVGKCQQ